MLRGVLLATLARWGIGGLVDDRTPFTTYYPAVVVATLLGGFWLGTLTIILSAVAACWIFMPPTFGLALDESQITAIVAFILVCLLLVAVVPALKAAVNLLLVEVDQRRKAHLAIRQLGLLVETSEDAIITKDLNGITTGWNGGAERIFGYVVHIDCSSKEDWLAILWEERGGPPVNGPPDREGFGGNLARKIVESQFRGRFFNEWKPGGLSTSGLSIRIEIPREHIAPLKAQSSMVESAECAP